jgi:hypothetical protein
MGSRSRWRPYQRPCQLQDSQSPRHVSTVWMEQHGLREDDAWDYWVLHHHHHHHHCECYSEEGLAFEMVGGVTTISLIRLGHGLDKKTWFNAVKLLVMEGLAISTNGPPNCNTSLVVSLDRERSIGASTGGDTVLKLACRIQRQKATSSLTLRRSKE